MCQLKYFLPYYEAEKKGKFRIIFVDETGFNLNNQGHLYGYSEKGKALPLSVPIKTSNTSLCAAIDNTGVIAYQIFEPRLLN